ncbi:hypothetical protein SLE2022_303660 [Rubroshorea leprosula]
MKFLRGSLRNGDLRYVLSRLQRCQAHTRHLLGEVSQREINSYNNQLASLHRCGDDLATWALFSEMHFAGLDLNAYAFTRVLSACSGLPGKERGKQVHSLMVKTGSDTGTVAKTALLNMYSKNGCLDDSVRVFEEVEFRDVVIWNALLSGFLRQGLAQEAFSVFAEMKRERVEFSEFTLCSVIKACASMKAFRQGRQVHGLVVVLGRDLVILSTALIDFYADVGHISEAMKVFSSLKGGIDSVMCNSLLVGCIKNQNYEEAFSIMSRMRPNVVALTGALSACSENSNLWIGKQIHCVALRFGFIDTQLCNVLLDMYAKCGKLRNVQSLFNWILHKDVVSWTTMIQAYGNHGYGLEALELFKKLGEGGSRVLPNSVTFLAVLSACGHSGLVDEGRECFNLMREKYGFDPGQEHYACFIDALGRAGKMDEAWCLFDSMVKNGTRPTAAVWITLLNACSLNQDVARGEFAAKHLLELEPDNPGNYVLLSNFNAAVGNWDSVDKLRDTMKKRGLVKEAGSSHVSLAGCQEAAAK